MGQAEERARAIAGNLSPVGSPGQLGEFISSIISGVKSGGGEALRKARREFPLEPAELREIAERESRALVERSVPPSPQEFLERIPRPPTPLELIAKPEDILPTTEGLRQAAKDIMPSPRSIVDAVNFAANPLEKVKLVAQIATPVTVILGTGLVAIAIFTK